MPRDRDVHAFHDRAPGYENGLLGRMHRSIAEDTADIALGLGGRYRRVLDVGCGTGYLLRLMAGRLPEAEELIGVDPAPGMIEVATSLADDARLRYSRAAAEALPCADASIDLTVSTTSFDHWEDQLAGLRECARVVVPGGRLVLTDLFSPWLLPTLVAGRRGRARTRRRAAALLQAAGFTGVTWHPLHMLVLATAVASR